MRKRKEQRHRSRSDNVLGAVGGCVVRVFRSRTCGEGLAGVWWGPGARIIPEEGLAVRMTEG